MFSSNQSALRVVLVGAFALGLSLLSGCGMGVSSGGVRTDAAGSGKSVSGILHGGPNPISGATVTLYTTTSNGYGATATVVTSTTTRSDGTFDLPVAGSPCPANEYAYVTAHGGTTGSGGSSPKTNASTLLMIPIGLCSDNYTFTGTAPSGANTYTGPSLFINEITTAVSAYALGNFMTVTDAGVVNIGAPATNHHTASATSPSAAGLAHAFANALSLVDIQTGMPEPFTRNASSSAGGAIVPVAELMLLGNILQSCVNSNGTTGTNTATSNDGTTCGRLYSLTTPPQAVTSPLPVPTNTMQAMLDLTRYPSPLLNTWNTGCTAAGSGTKSATSCIFGLASGIGDYANALTSAPPDWALVVIYGSGYGVQTGAACSSATVPCPGLVYPYYVALDYQDNVYILNQDAGTSTIQNIIALDPSGAPLWATPNDSTYSQLKVLSTDTAGHVLGTNATTNTGTGVVNFLRSFNTSDGSLFASVATGTSFPTANAVDANNNVYYHSTSPTTNLRRFVYNASSPTTPYTEQTFGTLTSSGVGGPLQIVLDSNLDVFGEEPSSGGVYKVDYALNVGSVASPSYTVYDTASVTGSVVASTAFGITMDASGNAYSGQTTGFTKITRTVSGSGSSATASLAAASPVLGTPLNAGTIDYFHYLFTDGAGNIMGADNDNGGGPAGIQVLDVADAAAPFSLGGYKGCLVLSLACGTGTNATAFSPRGMAIDSAGDVYLVSGAINKMAEYIGVAAPTWPGLSMLKTGKP